MIKSILKIVIFCCVFFICGMGYADESQVMTLHSNVAESQTAIKATSRLKRSESQQSEPIRNDAATLAEDIDIETLKNKYISPYNYTQDPIAYNMGISSVAGPNGTYHVGLSQIDTSNIFFDSSAVSRYDLIGQAWGQTGRFHGFAVGAGLQSAVVVQQSRTAGYNTTGVLSLEQAYLDYEYKDAFEITGGNILLTTPWVNSIGSFPGATYANGNNTYQGVTTNIQVAPSLLLTGFRAFTYLQYPNDDFQATNLYNTNGGPMANLGNTTTSGVGGVGGIWNPSDDYNLNVWFYQFYDYADMWYADNQYTLQLSKNVSFIFGAQFVNQSSNGSAITSTLLKPDSTTQTLGGINSNAVGLKWSIKAGDNTTTFAYNNVFGAQNSYLGGGIVTPYTYGLETDPLYTTPALNSIAELGSGSAYLIKNSISFMDNSLKASLAFAQFFVNQTYANQANLITEYDAALQYTIPKTALNLWSRVVYVSQPDYAGGDFWQPRIIINYNF